jgi:hypothetical protein
MLLSASANAQDVNTCVASSEKALSLKKSGKLIDARKELATCAADACPTNVKAECKKRIAEISAMIPGVVFDVKDASGNSVTRVKVSIDGVQLVDHLDGMAVPVDPGPHKFTFEVAGQASIEKTFLIAEGDKAHRETITLGAASTSGGNTTTNDGNTGTQTNAGGGEGESCMSSNDCAAPLRCIRKTCTAIKTGKPTEGAGSGGGGSSGGGSSNATPGQSSNGGVYLQALIGGFSWMYFPNFLGSGFSTDWGGFNPDIEFGFHATGRHDGFVVGFRQAFVLTMVPALAGGVSTLRLGWDIPIALGERELVIGPYVSAGVGYVFDGPSAGIHINGGADFKFFIASGFFAFGRFEAGAQCFHDGGFCAFDLVAGAGVGFAFGGSK